MLDSTPAHLCLALLASLCALRGHSQTTCPNLRQNVSTSCTQCDGEYDPAGDCSTCVGAESIECVEGQDCSVGDFTFSVLFHSYDNPTSMCGECGSNGETITCLEQQTGTSEQNCGLRFIYCLRPYGMNASDVPLSPQGPLTCSDNFTFQEGFVVQGDIGVDNFWNRSNPFTRELQLWPGKAQLYIVVYTFNNINPSIVDRLLIDLELGVNSGFTQRRTYIGRLNVAQFDLSFRVDRQCPQNYYGPECNVFCSGVEGEFSCDSEGNIVCVNSNLSPESNCTQCMESGGDPENNCTDITTTDDTTAVADTTPAPAAASSVAVIGGVVGGVIGGVLLLAIVLLLFCVVFMCLRRHSEKTVTDEVRSEDDHQVTPIKKTDKSQLQLQNPVYGTEEKAGVTATAEAEYSTIGDKKPEEHKFDNPIYGDKVMPNVYSHTTHNGNSHGPLLNTNSGLEEAPYSHVGDPHAQEHLYSHTSHSRTLEVPLGPREEYDAIGGVPLVDIGSHYEQADIVIPTDSVPSAAIYNELEADNQYSTLQQ